ncbi:hypothetical protein BSKO_09698 [Bryopsis sp. KO-2023]|nr:hypothetical protein BSKO_09698 [Bryopsis sp. KO-2023]
MRCATPNPVKERTSGLFCLSGGRPSRARRSREVSFPNRGLDALENRKARRCSEFLTCSAGSEGGMKSGTDLLGGPKLNIRKDSVTTEEVSLDDIPLESEMDFDYTELRDALKEGDFQKADDETRAKVIELAGSDAKGRGWVYFTEVKFMPVKDLQTIDKLWRAASDRKFGFSRQKEIFAQNRKLWPKFFKAIDWVTGENNDYRKWPKGFNYTKEAKAGHLPLTNCLRGTQLFDEIMKHPAFEKPKPSY